jgi:hypothetical protein
MNRLRHVLPVLIAFFALISTASAQTLLNSLDVQWLVDRGDATSHVALHRHFAALAAKYDADAERHRAMAHGFVGNPNRFTATPSDWHCEQAIREARAAAATLRQLARYHAYRAIDMDSSLPAGAAPYEGGLGAPAPTREQIRARESSARTRADHQFLEEYFTNRASEYLSVIAQHRAMLGNSYGTRRVGVHQDCEQAIEAAQRAADAAIAAATRHRQLATLG